MSKKKSFFYIKVSSNKLKYHFSFIAVFASIFLFIFLPIIEFNLSAEISSDKQGLNTFKCFLNIF